MSSNRNWVLKIDGSVFKTLKKVPRKDTESILRVLDSLSSDPFAGDIQKLKGEEFSWRRRVGSWRIFYDLHIAVKEINVTKIQRRTSNTY